ncbi:MAG: hypothetical protein WCY70_07425 [Methanoculleus sp.]
MKYRPAGGKCSLPVRIDDRDPGDAQEAYILDNDRIDVGLDHRCGKEGIPDKSSHVFHHRHQGFNLPGHSHRELHQVRHRD